MSDEIRTDSGLDEILRSLFDKVKDIVKSDTVFGKPIEVKGGSIIPISKIKIGFLAGSRSHNSLGASGGAVSVDPVGILVVLDDGTITFYSTARPTSSLVEKAINIIPDIAEKVIPEIKERLSKPKESKEEK